METKARYYDAFPNQAIRKRANQLNIPYVELAARLNAIVKERGEETKKITPEAVRQWVGGYSQPKYERLPDIAAILNCSLPFLFGVEEMPDMTFEQVYELTGLSEKALRKLFVSQWEEDYSIDKSKALRIRNDFSNLINCLLENDSFGMAVGDFSLMSKMAHLIMHDSEACKRLAEGFERIHGEKIFNAEDLPAYYASRISKTLSEIIYEKLNKLLYRQED